MKTDTTLPLLFMVLIVAGVIVLAVWSSSAVDLAALQVNATAAGSQVPQAELVISQAAGWALSAVIGIVVTAIAAGLAAWARTQWRTWFGQNKKWKSGPNARWQQTERAPRQASEGEIMRMLLMQQLTQGGATRKAVQYNQTIEADDNELYF